MQTNSLRPGAGIGWLKDGVNLGRNNPKAIFGGAALMLAVFLGLAIVLGIVAAVLGMASSGSTALLSLMLVFFVVMIFLMSALMVGYLRLIDNVESGRPAAATDVFAGFRDLGTSARAIGLVLVLMIIQNLLMVALIGLLAPDFGSWYLQNLQASMHGVAQAPTTQLPAGFGPASAVMLVVGLFFYAVQALGLGQVALGGRGVFGAFADGVKGAARNLLPLLVMLVALVAAIIVIGVAVMLLAMLVGLLVKMIGVWIAIVIAVPLYIAFLVTVYVVMFGVMYSMWHGILGAGTDAPGSEQAPGFEA